jgi:hypothetical protein
LPLLLVGTSILAGHLFVVSNSNASAGFFITFVLVLFFLFYFNVWTLLSLP